MDFKKKISIKILILGPICCGKTSIANYLADTDDNIEKEYHPTQGVRIVEFESNELELEGKSVNAEVELWDCSGDRAFEDCWPAIRYNANGAIFVCDSKKNVGSELLVWYNEFAQKSEINSKNILLLLHNQSSERLNDDSVITEFQIPDEMKNVTCVLSNIEHHGDELRLEFNNFLCNIIANAEI